MLPETGGQMMLNKHWDTEQPLGERDSPAWGLGPAEPSPEVLDANHLAPGPGPVHGPPIRIRALVRRGPCECSAHAAPTAPAWAPQVPGWLNSQSAG